MWYIYGETRVSKRTFEDFFFRDILITQNPQASFLQRNNIKYHVAAEMLLFQVAFSWMMERLHRDFEGNPFAQGMHDGVTLSNKKCYQAMGAQQIFRGVSYTLAFGFRHLRGHWSKMVADEFEKTFLRRANLTVWQVFWSMISDLAALKVASDLDISDAQKCKLHQGGKVGSSAMGLLVKTRAKQVLNPFDNGVELYTVMHKLACEFSYGDRAQQLDDICATLGMKSIKARVDLNGTRMTSLYNLFHANLRLRPAMEQYLATETAKVANLTTAAGVEAYERLLRRTPSNVQWQSAGECEAGLGSCKCQIVLSQTEKSYTGAMAIPVERHLRKVLSRDAPKLVIVSEKPNLSHVVERKAVKYGDMSQDGRTFFDRAEIAAEERFVNEMTDAELVKSMNDVRSVKFCDQYMTGDEIVRAKECTKAAYVEYCKKAHAHKHSQFPQQGGPEPTVAPAPQRKRGAAAFLQREIPDVAQGASCLQEADVLREFELAFNNWITFCSDINFVGEFPEELQGKEEDELDLVEDLLGLDISHLYVKAEGPTTLPMYKMPMLARQRIGENMAASFCERMNSIAKDILDEGHTLLNDPELEAMVILRANRAFMTKVRGEWREEITLYANMRGIGLEPK
jgi:hypothetical protein